MHGVQGAALDIAHALQVVLKAQKIRLMDMANRFQQVATISVSQLVSFSQFLFCQADRFFDNRMFAMLQKRRACGMCKELGVAI